MQRRVSLRVFPVAAAAVMMGSCTSSRLAEPVAPPPLGRIDPAATAVLEETAAKLEGARTLRVVASHRLDPALGLGNALDEGPLQITVQRPNQFHALQPAGAETREIAYNGRELCVMHPQHKHHALEPLRAASIEQFAALVDERFGFRPPVAELLSNDVEEEIMIHVTSAQMAGVEQVGDDRCQRLHFRQPGMNTDLWIGETDRLPRRMHLTFTNLPGSPRWDITFSRWELNPPVDAALFSKRPAADSARVEMLKSR